MEIKPKRKDTPEQIAARDRWLAAVSEELELPAEQMSQVTQPLLELINLVAHGPSRPGAPLTAFLVGLASAGDTDRSLELIERIRKLVQSYE